MSVTGLASQMLHILGLRPYVNLSGPEGARPRGASIGRLNSPSP
jgi:hypothetical protein